MARNNDRDRDRGSKRVLKDTRPRGKKKVCIFCKDHAVWVDYKDINLLRRFMSDRGKIRSRRVTGNCAQHQRDVQVAIKTAREVAMLPYTQRTVNERGPGRGPRPPRTGEGSETREARANTEQLESEDLDSSDVAEDDGDEIVANGADTQRVGSEV
jgi:small subunit ribosomal protein S18